MNGPYFSQGQTKSRDRASQKKFATPQIGNIQRKSERNRCAGLGTGSPTLAGPAKTTSNPRSIINIKYTTNSHAIGNPTKELPPCRKPSHLSMRQLGPPLAHCGGSTLSMQSSYPRESRSPSRSLPNTKPTGWSSAQEYNKEHVHGEYLGNHDGKSMSIREPHDPNPHPTTPKAGTAPSNTQIIQEPPH